MFYSVLNGKTSLVKPERVNFSSWTKKVAVFLTISQTI